MTQSLQTYRTTMRKFYRSDETEMVEMLLRESKVAEGEMFYIERRATELIHGMRGARRRFGGVDRFLNEFGLSTKEGVALMCLAEALLRIPDAETQNKLINNKIGDADWQQHVGQGEDLFVNASTWALMLTGKVLSGKKPEKITAEESSTMGKMVARLGTPVIRKAIQHAMRIMGRQFVMGRNMEEALKRVQADEETQNICHSFDMLGEAARTADDAALYFKAYRDAIHTLGQSQRGKGVYVSSGISIKLSALYPHYDQLHKKSAVKNLSEKLILLCKLAAEYDISLCVDAEEADRLDLSLDIIENACNDPELVGWNGFGLAIQAYQKRTLALIDWLAELARRTERRIMVRLVKGAYWDSEIKWAQIGGFEGYPVFTRKAATDVSYLACAQKLLAHKSAFYPQFATHNAHSLAAIENMAMGSEHGHGDFEFQRLHGMGEPLYHQIKTRVRVYAPVGSHQDLLPYLVRRLLENGANSSFVNRIQNDALPVADLVADPRRILAQTTPKPHPKIPLPKDIFGETRLNAPSLDLLEAGETDKIFERIKSLKLPLSYSQKGCNGEQYHSYNPANKDEIIGTMKKATIEDIPPMMQSAAKAQIKWGALGLAIRADKLDKLADNLTNARDNLLSLLVLEAGKTMQEAIGEWRESIDFCRYYAQQARLLEAPITLPSVTGESNQLSLHARGVFACISPWNFPLAIFTGQVAAALVAGNAVVAKPAEQTSLIACMVQELAHKAGIPKDVFQLAIGSGRELGGALIRTAELSGICFTGGTETAQKINMGLATRTGAILPFIAETGGQNAMIVDSSALPEQVADDVINSAFRAAGQRCSALRVLYLVENTADKMIEMIKGAATELIIGNPAHRPTDIGPVIDRTAQKALKNHAKEMDKTAQKIFDLQTSENTENGTYFTPKAYEINKMSQLTKEHFGPILHIIRYAPNALDDVINDINQSGYGLTLGLHSRIDDTIEKVIKTAKCGNIYINRDMVGAVVGSQPFGGENLSGTGPKAGGPHYLPQFMTERTTTINTTASGGNTSLIMLEE